MLRDEASPLTRNEAKCAGRMKVLVLSIFRILRGVDFRELLNVYSLNVAPENRREPTIFDSVIPFLKILTNFLLDSFDILGVELPT
jgi:hypothetical protein